MSSMKSQKTFEFDAETGEITVITRIVYKAVEGDSRYFRIRIGDETFYAHRLMWEFFNGPVPEGMHIDHINGNRYDNRLCNLRLATPQQNAQNRPKRQGTSSKYKGVYWSKPHNKWRAQIQHDGAWFNLGLYDSEEDAANAYLGASKLLHSHGTQRTK